MDIEFIKISSLEQEKHVINTLNRNNIRRYDGSRFSSVFNEYGVYYIETKLYRNYILRNSSNLELEKVIDADSFLRMNGYKIERTHEDCSFDLQYAKNGGDTFTKGGFKCRLVCDDMNGLYPLIFITTYKDGVEYCDSYDVNGCCFESLAASDNLVSRFYRTKIIEPKFVSKTINDLVEYYESTNNCIVNVVSGKL